MDHESIPSEVRLVYRHLIRELLREDNEIDLAQILGRQMNSHPEVVLCDIAPHCGLTSHLLLGLQWQFLENTPRFNDLPRLRQLLFGEDSVWLSVVNGSVKNCLGLSSTRILEMLHRHGACTERMLSQFVKRTLTGTTENERERLAHIFSDMYGDENTELLLNDVTMHVMMLTCFGTTPEGYSVIERLLTRILSSPHFHMVAFCPGLLHFLLHLATGKLMPDFVRCLLQVAGTAVIVQIRRSKCEHNAHAIVEFMAQNSGSLLYELWPDLTKHFVNKRDLSLKRTRSDQDKKSCPILLDLTDDPVLASDGFVYDRDTILTYLSKGNTKSPMTREHLSTILFGT